MINKKLLLVVLMTLIFSSFNLSNASTISSSDRETEFLQCLSDRLAEKGVDYSQLTERLRQKLMETGILQGKSKADYISMFETFSADQYTYYKGLGVVMGLNLEQKKIKTAICECTVDPYRLVEKKYNDLENLFMLQSSWSEVGDLSPSLLSMALSNFLLLAGEKNFYLEYTPILFFNWSGVDIDGIEGYLDFEYPYTFLLDKGETRQKPEQQDIDDVLMFEEEEIEVLPVPGIDGSEKDKPEVFVVIDVMPEFKGGDQAMMRFIGENMTYPEVAKQNGIEGLVVVSFVVSESGALQDFEIRRDIGGGCGEEALRVIKMMKGKWKPGKQDGKRVSVLYNLPVRFKLEPPETNDDPKN